MFILDTNVLSETLRSSPSPEVRDWMKRQASSLFTTTISQAEMLYGVELLPKGRRRSALEREVFALFEEDFKGRILPFDSEAAKIFPLIAVMRRSAGRPISELDAQVAAIARSRSATLATRNTADFEGCGTDLVNPWTERA